MATNDEAESVLGRATSQLQRFGQINIASGAAVRDLKRNSFLSRKKPSGKSDKQTEVLFHEFDPILREAIILLAMMVRLDCIKLL